MIIVLEGGDGCGKTTVGKLLAKSLGCECLHFPDDNEVTGPLIREYLKRHWTVVNTIDDSDNKKASTLAFQALQVTNRMAHMSHLRKFEGHPTNHIVLVRYWQSGVVYGTLDGLDRQWLIDVHSDMARGDINLLLSVDPKEGLRRCALRDEKPERYEGKLDFAVKVRDGYHNLWTEHQYGWKTIDANPPLDVIMPEVELVVDNKQTALRRWCRGRYS